MEAASDHSCSCPGNQRAWGWDRCGGRRVYTLNGVWPGTTIVDTNKVCCGRDHAVRRPGSRWRCFPSCKCVKSSKQRMRCSMGYRPLVHGNIESRAGRWMHGSGHRREACRRHSSLDDKELSDRGCAVEEPIEAGLHSLDRQSPRRHFVGCVDDTILEWSRRERRDPAGALVRCRGSVRRLPHLLRRRGPSARWARLPEPSSGDKIVQMGLQNMQVPEEETEDRCHRHGCLPLD